ncbi:MAG: type II toxin-antitoxin system RelE/ParE family toxin [Candidatus Moeniiplasma glomeromycotorum]|nr:type II toxin-antitoxin system RelE/ParE family toxin [Candidatus Moeniiplasma glomeromycotorum]MCE8169327.1 type II toxin-antitoxin system RelE/ParE family toxin [Candidatus Moeniiplasma glomeromycotorum]MCE8169540.1 type II toxin-antitoxin system RelE/ParE family toxin [Candidatus Moeniiplasma glomeromycotorum]
MNQEKRIRKSLINALEDFKDKDIAKLWYEGKRVKRLPSYLDDKKLLAVLQILNSINHPLELRNLLPPKSKIRQIRLGRRRGQWKFNLDSQFRVIFTWKEDVKKIIRLEVGEFHDE